MASGWKPFYLRRTVLLCYGIILALLIALLEGLLALSEQSQGLATGQNEFRYLWTYGPTAFMTLLTAIWSRVAFQAQSVTPWFRALGGQPSSVKEALLLDYTSMLQPIAIIKSLRNRDWIVGTTILGLLVSQLTVALSTGLFQIHWENVELGSVPITLETTLSNDSHAVQPLTTLDHYATIETFDGNAQYRRGTTGGFAYQTLNSKLTEIAELRTTVDGFTSNLACEPASLSVTNINYNVPFENEFRSQSIQTQFSTTLKSNQCLIGWNFSVNLFPENLATSGRFTYPAGVSTTYVGRLITGKCNNGTDLESNRVALVFGVVKYSYGPFKTAGESNFSISSVEVDTSSQILCQPTYQIARLDLVLNGTNDPFITRLENSPTTLQYIQPWDIMEAMLATQNLTVPNAVTPAKQLFPSADADIDNSTINLFQVSGISSSKSLVEPQFLAVILSRYFRMFAAQIASISLMHPASDSSTASATIRRYRLTVNYAACQELVALLSLSLACCVFVLILRWKKPPLSQRTNHITGVAEATTNDTAIMESICYSNPPEHKKFDYSDAELDYLSFKENVTSETTQLHTRCEIPDQDEKLNIGTIVPRKYFKAPGTSPGVLRVWVVGLIASFLIAIIGALETLLQISQRNRGFCKVDDDPYVRYAFAVIPALILGLVSIYFGSVDYESRTLTPYWLMSGQASSTKSLHLDLLNSSIPRIILSEIRSKSYVSLAVTIAALIASLFTTFTSPLFSGAVTSQMLGLQLQTNEPLRIYPGGSLGGSDKALSSLILRANLTYPPNTYEDLTFVGVTIKESNTTLPPNATLQSNDSSLGSNSTVGGSSDVESLIHVAIPALRARLSCRFPNFHIDPIDEWFRLIVEGEDEIHPFTFLPDTVSPSGSIFGMTTWADSSMIYSWGQAFNSTDGVYSLNATVMACNETIEAVDVQTVLYAHNQSIYSDIPPQPNEATMRMSSATYMSTKDS
ncbi:hypothetical protein F4779DRAFT_233877 [Xylariaceae sp. FL0662B]|nr:hypothetical protein F4779DRAFT_233877 [Xylariaceae sp. FL0662B]